MFILDKPYVSDFLASSAARHRIPVLRTPFSEQAINGRKVALLDEKEFIRSFSNGYRPLLYTNSENAIGWISRNLAHTDLPEKIELFKDKVRFRKLLSPLDPGFFYREVKLQELDRIDPADLPLPFVIKPAVGFFSLGVYTVESPDSWPGILEKIQREVELIRRVYPAEVLDTTRFIIEEYIRGREFAFDAYYNREGRPVILGLLEHLFASASDVSDRVYISSAAIFGEFLKPFTAFLEDLGRRAGLRNFPLHVEVRIDPEGNIRPIEINPLRFGGWCTTADMTWFAYGSDSYEAVAGNLVPDWDRLMKGKEDKVYSNIVLTNSTGYAASQIRAFDYESLKARFENPLELRRADFREFLIFGFLFAETSIANFSEIEWILNDDLREFITLDLDNQ